MRFGTGNRAFEIPIRHAHVRLHFCRVWDFDREPESHESQAFAWVDLAENQFEPLLPATVPLMCLLTLPPVYAISCATDMGVPEFVARLREVLAAQRCVVRLREPGMDDAHASRCVGDGLV